MNDSSPQAIDLADNKIEISKKSKVGSNRSFGLVFTVVFVFIGILPLLQDGAIDSIRWWAVAVAVMFFTVSTLYPRLLAPLNQIWYRLGLLLHKIVNPIILGLIYFVAVLSTSLLLKIFRKDPLRLRLKTNEKSYWIIREPLEHVNDSMSNQY